MSYLSDIYKKTKKKIKDLDIPSAYKSARNVERSQKKIARESLREGLRTTYDAIKSGRVGETISSEIGKYDYFKPDTSGKVRVRDFARELPTGIDKTGQAVARDVARFGISAAEAPKSILTGKASGKFYDTPFGRVNSFQSEAQNRVNRGDPLWKAIGNPALETIFAAGDIAAVAKPVIAAAKTSKRVVPQVRNLVDEITRPLSKTRTAQAVKEDIKTATSARPTTRKVYTGKDPKLPKGAKVEESIPGHWRKSGYEPVFEQDGKPAIFPELPKGKRTTGPVKRLKGNDEVTGAKRYAIRTEEYIPKQTAAQVPTKRRWKTPGLVDELVPKPGLGVEDVSKKSAAKSEKARQIVQSQIKKQRTGSKTSEPGFVSPGAVRSAKRAPLDDFTKKLDEVPAPWEKTDDALKISDADFEAVGFKNEPRPKTTASRKIDKNIIDNTKEGSEVYTELDLAAPGNRYGIPSENSNDMTFLREGSSYPEWVDTDLRSRDLFDKVMKHLDEGTVPQARYIKQRRLYDQIHNEIRRRQGKGAVEQFIDEVPKPGTKTSAKDPFGPVEGYNKYQKAAYEEKGRDMKRLSELLAPGKNLQRSGYRKYEIQKMTKKEIELKSKLLDLGYPKKAIEGMDFDRMNLILRRKVPHRTLQDYYKRKHDLDTNILEGIDPTDIEDINPVMGGFRDMTRNVEKAFGNKAGLVKERLLNPFDNAKAAMFEDTAEWLQKLDDQVVKGLGIKKGSKLSAAVQQYGEKKMSLDQLQKEFPNDWERVVKADKFFRDAYDGILDELNRVREYYNPTHPLYPETTKIIPKRQDYYRHFQEMSDGFGGLRNLFETPASIDPDLAVSSQYTKPTGKWLSFAQRRKGDKTTEDAVGGFLDYLRSSMYAKYIDPQIKRFRGTDAEVRESIRKSMPYMEESRGLAEELSKKLDPIQQMAETNDFRKVTDILTERGASEAQAEWMARDIAEMSDYGKITDYLKRKLPKGQFDPKATAEDVGNNMNNFLKFLDNFANDLAGKTNPLDRPVQDLTGRMAFRAIDWLNRRTKLNTILGNFSSSIAQVFNIPNGVGHAGIKNITRGAADNVAAIFSKTSPMDQSGFLKERYFSGFDDFDTGLIQYPKRFAGWLITVGDEIGTKIIWNANYRKAISEGIDNPIRYADDWTRKLVAGRGIGEVPVAQKSKLVQMVMPFQLEVNNQWFVLRDYLKDPSRAHAFGKMLKWSLAVYAMNNLAEKVRGSDVALDPIQSVIDAYEAFEGEEDKAKGTVLGIGRILGEVLSNVGGGQSIAAWYPEYGAKIAGKELPTREELFGDNDPTRFGGGPLFSRGISDPLTRLLPPFGGVQMERTWDGINALRKGYSETDKGRIRFPIDETMTNRVKTFLFGEYSTPEAREYFDENRTPLGEKQSEKMRLMDDPEDRSRFYDRTILQRDASHELDDIRSGKLPGVRSAEAEELPEGYYRLSDGSIYVQSLDKEYDTPELAMLAVEKDDMERSEDTFRDLGDTVLLKDSDGRVREYEKDDYTIMLNDKRMNLAKDRKDFEAWIPYAEENLALLETKLGENLNEYERMQVEDEYLTLLRNYAKYGEYGGFKKPKKAKKPDHDTIYPAIDSAFAEVDQLLAGMMKKPVASPRLPSFRPSKIKKVRRKKRA